MRFSRVDILFVDADCILLGINCNNGEDEDGSLIYVISIGIILITFDFVFSKN